ncbi:MAG: hypothetical protein OXU23_01155, partial [Candidatus Poribacteria bacterium]|nr:hypothetical protein [Candidatus Poribacteria bacterium]
MFYRVNKVYCVENPFHKKHHNPNKVIESDAKLTPLFLLFRYELLSQCPTLKHATVSNQSVQ